MRQTLGFRAWLDGLSDRRAQERIAIRLVRLQGSLFGDTKAVGSNVFELRIDYGPGYRVYYTRRGASVVLLLAGGDKSTQARDIRDALALAADLKGER